MSPEDLAIYSQSDNDAQDMVRMTALQPIGLEGGFVPRIEADGDLMILPGQRFACQPDLAALLHREGAARILVEPAADDSSAEARIAELEAVIAEQDRRLAGINAARYL